MDAELIRYDYKKACEQIKRANKKIAKLRMQCKHENVENGNYLYRAGVVERALICSDCGELIKIIP